jgi:hypothetical protein
MHSSLYISRPINAIIGGITAVRDAEKDPGKAERRK